MKEIKFKTSKGEFVIYDDANGIGKHLPYDLLTKIGYLKNITEEQASDIVFRPKYTTCTESLHSLLKSKGIHLYENPYEGVLKLEFPTAYQKAEQKTFYNPYIFKIND